MASIPKIIHYCWLSGDPFPELIKICISSWKKYLPDYEFMLWDRERFDIAAVPWVKEAFEAGKYAFAADYIRLYALYHEGGIYLDADVEVMKSFNDLLNQTSFIGYETSGDLEPAIIGAEPGCEWIAECLRHYDGRHFCQPDGTWDTAPLPIMVMDKLRTISVVQNSTPVSEPVTRSGVTLYPAEFFSPKDAYLNVIQLTHRTYAVHHFDGHWVDRTFIYRIKQIIHRILHVTVGSVNHRRIVCALRAIKNKTFL